MNYHHPYRKYFFAGLLSLGLCAGLSVHAQFGAPGFGGFGGGFGGSRSRSSSSSNSRYNTQGTVGDAVISIDPETRDLIVIADDETSRYIEQVVRELDRPKPQVLIKVVFVEVQHNNASDIGIEGGWGRQNMNGTITGANAANVFGLGSLNTAGSNVTQNVLGQPTSAFQPVSPITSQGAGLYQLMGQDWQVTLRAIAQQGKAKILSRPSIVARNNQPATITVGQTVPLINSVRFDNYGNAINSIGYQDVGIILHVTPFITSDGMVEMIVSPQTSDLVQDRSQWVPISTGASGTVSAPLINNRSADTVVVTANDQTVVIGGLMQDSKAESEAKVPVLGDVPLLGNLFKRKMKSTIQTELLIFLTPVIINAPNQMASVSSQETRKMQLQKSFTDQELNKYLDSTFSTNAPARSPQPRRQ